METINKMNFWNRFYKHLLISCLALGVALSCSDDFLNVKNTDVLSNDIFPATVKDVDLLVNDVYGRMRKGFLNDYPQALQGTAMPHYAEQDYEDNRFDEASQINYTTLNPNVEDIWSSHYENIGKANNTLEGIDQVRGIGGLTADELQTLSYREGEVRFLRAWNYYYLVNFFSERIGNQTDDTRRGVPIISKVPTSLQETKSERATVKQVWDFIKSDLRKSKTLLAGKTWGSSERARINIWGVKAFLGKAHVFTQKWDSAKIELKDVIDNSGKSLVPYSLYMDMFNGKNSFNNESIFEINYNNNDLSSSGWNTEQDATTKYPILIAARYFKVENGKETNEGNGFCNLFIHDKSMLRFGWTDTTRVNYARSGYKNSSLQIRQNKTVDPRLWVNVLQPRVDSMRAEGAVRAIANYQTVYDDKSLPYNWPLRKFNVIDRQWGEAPGNAANAMNIYWLRLADIYLLYAEACQETGENAIALEYINKVKRRAYDQSVDSPSSTDYKSLSDNTIASASDPLHSSPLRYERWAELFGEQGSWWFDVCRWRLGQAEATYYQRVRSGNLGWSDRNYALPIPQTQINADDIGQNEGY